MEANEVHTRGPLARPVTTAMTVVLVLVGVLAMTVGTASAASYSIVNTGGVGVRQRHNPAVGSTYSGVAPEGSVVVVECQQFVPGQAMGNYGNELWFRVHRSGTGSWWVNDTYTNSPRKAKDPAIAGIPMCNAPSNPPPAPPPSNRPASGPYLAVATNHRDCTNTGLPGCAARGTLPANMGVSMACWIDDSSATGRYTSSRWFYVTAANGVRGFVHSSNVERQANVGHCGSHRGVAAARWASMQIGETRPNAGETNGNPMDRWSGWCYVLAWDAHALSHGTRSVTGVGSAQGAFNVYDRRGVINRSTDPNAIPIGAIVFWTYGSVGHAAIYVGQGHVVSTQGDGSGFPPVDRLPMSRWGTPLGWVSPSSI